MCLFCDVKPAAPIGMTEAAPEESIPSAAAIAARKQIFRKDYQPINYAMEKINLVVDLRESNTKVTSTLNLRKKNDPNLPRDLVLHGDGIELLELELDGVKLEESSKGYRKDGFNLILSEELLKGVEDDFVVKAVSTNNPKTNFQLQGLYKTDMYCTQCEPFGFRKICYGVDRPDVMSLFTVRLEADKKECPVLLCNGNIIEKGDCEEEGRHYAVFEDPFKKPTYLFAIVGGDLECIEDTFITMSGREVKLYIHSDPVNSGRLKFAMQCLKEAMVWDEKEFGREYDLDVFHLVAARDFTMGAMENKGLNIFNASALLADPSTTNDDEFNIIRGVIGHEYFHNWTGNRVTLRDWFELTLKEGLTVFREQLFSESFTGVEKRMREVDFLKSVVFVEDSSSVALPIRPESCYSVNNFYTSIVYRKGAEVIRMYRTLLKPKGFREAMDLYFDTHDGEAVTCDDYRNCMSKSSKRDLTQFERWYTQSGVPEVKVVKNEYKPEEEKLFLTITQKTPPSVNQPEKLPLHIPIAIGLIGKTSKKDLLEPPTIVLELTEEEQSFEIPCKEEPVLSFLRDFSAPVRATLDQSEEDMHFLMLHDSNTINRYNLSHKLEQNIILERYKKIVAGEVEKVEGRYNFGPLNEKLCGFISTLLDGDLNESLNERALMLALPPLVSIAAELTDTHPTELYEAKHSVVLDIREFAKEKMLSLYRSLTKDPDYVETLERSDMSRRRMRNVLLTYLTATRDKEAAEMGYNHYKTAKVMTDRATGLSCVASTTGSEREAALEDFYKSANGNYIMLDKWFTVQASADVPDTLENVKRLSEHADFQITNPNSLRSLISAFALNYPHFHRADGEGYKLIADFALKADKYNSLMGARICQRITYFKNLEPVRRGMMKKELERVMQSPEISKDVYELATKALKAA